MAATIWYEKDADLSVFDGKKVAILGYVLRWTIRRFSTLRCVFWASRNKYCMPAFGPCRRTCGCAGLFFLPPDSAVLSVFVASLFALSSFLSYVFLLPARSSLCP